MQYAIDKKLIMNHSILMAEENMKITDEIIEQTK